jgi:aspartyl-tRNA(Asn)/glutamyl-tRNA(Gln) amidotransferase subunit B
MTDVLRKLKETGSEIGALAVRPAMLAELVRLIDDGTVSGKLAKDLFEQMCASGEPAARLIERQGLRQLSDRAAVEAAAREVLAGNPGPVAQYRAGKTKTLGFLVGQLMKATAGKANPQLAGEVLKSLLEEETSS